MGLICLKVTIWGGESLLMQEQDRPNTIVSIRSQVPSTESFTCDALDVEMGRNFLNEFPHFLLLISVAIWDGVQSACSSPRRRLLLQCSWISKAGAAAVPYGTGRGTGAERDPSSYLLPVLPSLSSTPLCSSCLASLHVAHRAGSVLEW